MAKCTIRGAVIKGVSSAVPSKRFDNAADAKGFSEDEVRKVIGMAGVKSRQPCRRIRLQQRPLPIGG